jgi:hypothetical protein
MDHGRVVAYPYQCSRIWYGLRPDEAVSGRSPVLIVEDLVVICSVQYYKATQKFGAVPAFFSMLTAGIDFSHRSNGYLAHNPQYNGVAFVVEYHWMRLK